MATIASTDVTITVQSTSVDRGGQTPVKEVVALLNFCDASLTYPSGGITLPLFSGFGLARELRYLQVIDASATTVIWKYDYVNKKLRAYASNAEITTGAAALAAQVVYVVAKGW